MNLRLNGSLALGLALAMGSAQSGNLLAPLPYNNYLEFEAGQVCEFPIQFSANGKGLWLLDGSWQSAIDELGDPAQPLRGKGRRIDLCRLLH